MKNKLSQVMTATLCCLTLLMSTVGLQAEEYQQYSEPNYEETTESDSFWNIHGWFKDAALFTGAAVAGALLAHTWDCKGKKGHKGSKGPTGPTGATGATGPSAGTGSTGSTGGGLGTFPPLLLTFTYPSEVGMKLNGTDVSSIAVTDPMGNMRSKRLPIGPVFGGDTETVNLSVANFPGDYEIAVKMYLFPNASVNSFVITLNDMTNMESREINASQTGQSVIVNYTYTPPTP